MSKAAMKNAEIKRLKNEWMVTVRDRKGRELFSCSFLGRDDARKCAAAMNKILWLVVA